jgi:hypothetical protein
VRVDHRVGGTRTAVDVKRVRLSGCVSKLAGLGESAVTPGRVRRGVGECVLDRMTCYRARRVPMHIINLCMRHTGEIAVDWSDQSLSSALALDSTRAHAALTAYSAAASGAAISFVRALRPDSVAFLASSVNTGGGGGGGGSGSARGGGRRRAAPMLLAGDAVDVSVCVCALCAWYACDDSFASQFEAVVTTDGVFARNIESRVKQRRQQQQQPTTQSNTERVTPVRASVPSSTELTLLRAPVNSNGGVGFAGARMFTPADRDALLAQRTAAAAVPVAAPVPTATPSE